MVLPAFVFLLALGLRVAWILTVPSKPVGDFAMYWESATHLLEHGRFDDQFIYMPGYVLLTAGVQALGGGQVALKLVSAVLAALAAPLVYGLALRLWNRRAAAVAGVLYALWPGGVAVSSVTGTDMPAAVMVTAGAFALAQVSPRAPYAGTWVGGALLGLAAWVRAVALPLAPLSAGLLWAGTRRVRVATIGAAFATVAALLVLTPWAVRNHQRYGQAFLTDSHGGLTALVGAYPNSDGQFTRALNRSFETVTGIPWLGAPHRKADEWAYQEAQRWTRFEPWYAIGLGLARADKLLSNERSLLYWPLYREGVLKPEKRAFFDRWRREIETITDVFWWCLLLSCLAAVPLALAQRNWPALGLVPLQLALTGVYVLYFSESRYHLSMAMLAFPAAGGAWTFALDETQRIWLWLRKRQVKPSVVAVVAIATTLLLTLALWRGGQSLGHRLLQNHRWAVHACHVEQQPQHCLWQRADAATNTPSPVRGVFDGVGLRLGNAQASAQLNVPLRSGPHVLTATWEAVPRSTTRHPSRAAWPDAVQVEILVNDKLVLRAPPSLAPSNLSVRFAAQAGNNRIVVRVQGSPLASGHTLWLDNLRIEAEASVSLPATPICRADSCKT